MRFWKSRPGATQGQIAAASSVDYSTLVDRATEELRLKTEAAVNLFHIDRAQWDADLTARTIRFTSPEGLVATAPVQVVGTFNSQDSTWLWSWANSTISAHAMKDALLIREYGRKHGIAELTERKFPVSPDESDCWRFSAVACYLAQAQGAYRGPSGNVRVFMTYHTVTIGKARD